MEVRHLADGAVLAGWPDLPEAAANETARALASDLSREGAEWLLDAIPAARTLLVLFDPDRRGHPEVVERLSRASAGSSPAQARTIHLPTCYGGDAGPDLEEIASTARIAATDLARLHASAEHRVTFLGFAPGFAYMRGTPQELSLPRLATPRLRVPARSLAVADGYTGIYPEASPGGFWLIGRVAATLFDPGATQPSLLLPGDRAVFDPIEPAALAAFEATLEAERPVARVEAILRVSKPGVFTVIQGGPRYGLGALGVGAGGAMDLASLAVANGIVGNSPFAGALEAAIAGPELLFLADTTFAVPGALAQTRLDGNLVVGPGPHCGKRGTRLAVGPIRGGFRAYLAFGGGLALPAPGTPARPLRIGDLVGRAEEPAPPPLAVPRRIRVPREGEIALRALAGPQWDFFSSDAQETFFRASFRSTPHSDRRGMRLDGPVLELSRPSDIPPEGTAPGSVQVPGAGIPIVLGPDRPVTGGYAKIATIISTDLPLLAQARPGTMIRFSLATLEEALAARRDGR
jgi:KipI family sensor histidine kinase inhibitor